MELLYLELDALTQLRKRAEQELITEARRHHVPHLEELPRAGSDPHGGAVGHHGHTVSVRQQAWVLELLWTGDRNEELVGLGAQERWRVDQGACAADTRAESELQPHVEACVQEPGSGRARVGVHWELWSFAAGGMSLHDVRRVGTILPAEAIGHGNNFGSIAVGKLADLQVLDANPLDDIRNTTSMWMCLVRGGIK